MQMFLSTPDADKHESSFKGMLRRNIEHFLKKRIYEKSAFSEVI